MSRVLGPALLGCAALSACLFTAQAGAAGDAVRPNILLILADDMGYSDIGCYGSDRGNCTT